MNSTFQPEASLSFKLHGHVIGFISLTLPVWLYFTLSESSAKAATIGKRILRIKVMSNAGGQAGFKGAALRNALKFLPWELSHVAIWYVPERPFVDPMPEVNLAICTFALILFFSYGVSLFLAEGRTPYDRVARTAVIAN